MPTPSQCRDAMTSLQGKINVYPVVKNSFYPYFCQANSIWSFNNLYNFNNKLKYLQLRNRTRNIMWHVYLSGDGHISTYYIKPRVRSIVMNYESMIERTELPVGGKTTPCHICLIRRPLRLMCCIHFGKVRFLSILTALVPSRNKYTCSMNFWHYALRNHAIMCLNIMSKNIHYRRSSSSAFQGSKLNAEHCESLSLDPLRDPSQKR